MKIILLYISYTMCSTTYFSADPFYLLDYESFQFNNSKYQTLEIRPHYPFVHQYNETNLFINSWYYYNDNAPNLENSSNKWVGRGSNFFSSIHLDYVNSYFHFSIEPYIVSSENLYFNNYHSDPVFLALNDGYKKSDRPYVEYGLRESQFIINYNNYGIGFSNTNMWWGPGMHTSINMSNNTSGFPYFFVGTTTEKRCHKFGYNFQYIFSKLNKNITEPYFTGINASLSYYSKTILSIGLIRTFLSGGNLTPDDISITQSMLLPFQGFYKRDLVIEEHNDQFPEVDQTASIYLSMLFPESKLKLFFEFGKNDHSWSFYDLIKYPYRASSTLIGFRKYDVLGFNKLIFGFEYMKNSNLFSIRANGHGEWYNRLVYDYGIYSDRRWVAHSGSDSDDLFIYFGYLSKLDKFILSLNHERHGILKSIEKTNENIMYVPETKIEIRLDWRKKISSYEIFIYYEYELVDNLGISEFSIDAPWRKSNVIGIGLEKSFF